MHCSAHKFIMMLLPKAVNLFMAKAWCIKLEICSGRTTMIVLLNEVVCIKSYIDFCIGSNMTVS
jgi:hypothetical protein